MCGVQATEVLFWELKFSLTFPDSCTGAAAAGSLLGGRERVCVCFRGSPAKEAAGTMSKIRRKWLSMTGKRLSSLRRSRESSLQIQETKEIMEERDRERCSRKSGGGTCPKECPSWLRAVPQYFPSSPCAPSGVGLPVSSSKGNWP